MTAQLRAAITRKHYGGRLVLDNIELEIAAGEIVSLVGPSGCGKSTVLRIAAGLERDFGGEVSLDGEPLHGPTRAIGVMFQEPRLFPWLTVAKNVAFGARGAVDEAQVADLLREVGLAAHADSLPKQLSGGQAQRVAIARALYTRPRLLLLDEPFSAVDALARIRLQELLLAVARRHAASVLIVTHDADEAAYLADRVLVLDADPGRLRREIQVPLARPRDRRDPRLAAIRSEILTELMDSHVI
jgi:sulfonate transport system ATP-binding protein